MGVMSLMLVLTLGFAMEHFSFVSHAESKGKITASSSVNIRKEASSSSAAVGSAEKDATVDIRGKVTASDGTVWYQVFVDANTLGYIRSDLVQITDGTTPPTVEPVTSTQTAPQTTPQPTTPTTNTNETPVEVAAVEPLSATVTNGQKVRVRSNASTTSSIVTSVQSGLALTVTGQANGTDGKDWYRVEFISDGENVVGFIRSDYVALSGELVPVTENVPEEIVPEEPVEEVEEPEEIKKWDTILQEDKWYLQNTETAKQYVIDDLFTAAQTNAQLFEDSQKTVKSQKIAVILLVILLIACAGVIAMLYLKLKDMSDSAYFSEAEKEAARRRENAKAQNGKKVVHTVGPDKKPENRSASAQKQSGKPVGSQSQGSRPAGTPQGNRPAGVPSQGGRTTGNQTQSGRPTGTQPQSGRVAGTQPQGTKNVGAQSQERRVETPKSPNAQNNTGWKSKNFMTDDDEFEFEFLNWDGEEE